MSVCLEETADIQMGFTWGEIFRDDGGENEMFVLKLSILFIMFRSMTWMEKSCSDT